MLTQSELKKRLHYNPDTGIFIRLNSYPGGEVGSVAGFNSNGYLKINVCGEPRPAHRLAWLYVYGEFPKYQIDHINHIKDDNRIINLRDVTHLENHKNKSISTNNASGVTGVCWGNAANRWLSQIGASGKILRLGSFTDKFEAICARKSAENKYGFHPNHGNKL